MFLNPSCQSTLDPCNVTLLCWGNVHVLSRCSCVLHPEQSDCSTRWLPGWQQQAITLHNHFRSHISDHMTTRKSSALKATVTTNPYRSQCLPRPLNSPFWQPILHPGHSSSLDIRRWSLQVPLCLGTRRGTFPQAAFGHGQSTPDALPWQNRRAMSTEQ